jgi:hypothetical protein
MPRPLTGAPEASRRRSRRPRLHRSGSRARIVSGDTSTNSADAADNSGSSPAARRSIKRSSTSSASVCGPRFSSVRASKVTVANAWIDCRRSLTGALPSPCRRAHRTRRCAPTADQRSRRCRAMLLARQPTPLSSPRRGRRRQQRVSRCEIRRPTYRKLVIRSPAPSSASALRCVSRALEQPLVDVELTRFAQR